MIQYGKQKIDKSDIKAVAETLKSDWLTQGPKIREFEKALATYAGSKYAVAATNGTAALHLAYLAAGLGKNEEVITSPNTFVATTNMLLVLGAKPVFCDIRTDTNNIDEGKIEKLINNKTKAIVPVHFAGQPCAMEKISKIAEKYKLLVIEDACHALGAKYKNDKIGRCRHSDMAIFSFHPVKSITTGEGGAILTNNKIYYEKMIRLRTHGIAKNPAGKNVMTELGYNYRMTDMQAALGISQLKKIDDFIKARREIFSWYRHELNDLKKIILPIELKNNYSSWHIHVIRTNNPKDRDGLASYLKNKSIGVNFHYPAVYGQPYYQNHGYKNIRLANAEIYEKTCLTIPCYPTLKKSEVKFISQKIKDYFNGK